MSKLILTLGTDNLRCLEYQHQMDCSPPTFPNMYVAIDPWGVDIDYFGNHCTKPKKFKISVVSLTDSAPIRLRKCRAHEGC
ncbi:hypothetical protein TNCV_1252371 [Trichonephila clavipes]|nr:hypothetical protein TNCV_1252371 [Trichonephila clavipes]